MPRYGTPATVSGRPRGTTCRSSDRDRPHRTTSTLAHGSNRQPPLQGEQYRPNESLFDRESVIDMVSSDRSSGATVCIDFESDSENCDPTTSLSGSLLSHSGQTQVPYTSTPLREDRVNILPQHAFSRGTFETNERQHAYGLQSQDIVAMLQEQQQLLQTLLRTQKDMKECQNTFDQKLSALQQQVLSISSSCPTSSSEDRNSKLMCKVTRELTVSFVCIYSRLSNLLPLFNPQKTVAAVHDTLEEGFRPFERYVAQSCLFHTVMWICCISQLNNTAQQSCEI